ncbi:hypothetical protein DRQ18_05655 [bacterium]|nr:MAG: hypothetical protein DRQ18_05655 [bacterium]
MLPECVKRILWDVEKDEVDIREHREFLIKRILEYGDPESIKWVRENYTPEEIKKVIEKGRGLSPKTITLWKYLLKMEEER